MRVSDGMCPIVYVHASRLGMDTPENEADELPWAMRRQDPEDPPS